MMRQILAGALLVATLTGAAAQNVFFPANPGDMIVKGNAGAWTGVPGGTAGCVLTSNGPTAAPTWNCALALNFSLPPIATNRVWGNVSGVQAVPSQIDVNQFLDTVGYDTLRTPTAGSFLIKTATTWQTVAAPVAFGWVLTSAGAGGTPYWTAPGAIAVPGAAGTCLVSNGPTVAPTYQICTDSGALQKASNLSDLVSASAARTNLGLGSLAVLSTILNAQVDNAAAIVSTKLQNTVTAAGSPVARTVQSKLNDVVFSVKDYGATGDGTTNDAAAIQAAVDAAGGSSGNAVVDFPFTANCYRINTTIDVDPLVTTPGKSTLVLRGVGGTGSGICNNGTNIATFNVAPTYAGAVLPGTTITIEGLYFAPPTGTSTTVNSVAIKLTNASDAIIRNNVFYSQFNAITFGTTYGLQVLNNTFANLKCAAMMQPADDGSLNALMVVGNFVKNSGQTSDCPVFDLYSGAQMSFVQNNVEYANAVMRISGSASSIRFHSNYIEHTDKYVIRCDAGGATCKNWSLVGNWFNANNASSASIFGKLQQSLISGNSFGGTEVVTLTSDMIETDFGQNTVSGTLSGSTAWKTVAFQGTWANSGGGLAPFGFRKKWDGTVELKGTVTGGGAAHVVTLPAGYCPTDGTRNFSSHTDGTNNTVTISVTTGCAVNIAGTTTNIPLDVVRFTPY